MVLLKGVIKVSLVVRNAEKTGRKLVRYVLRLFSLHQSDSSPKPEKYDDLAHLKYGYIEVTSYGCSLRHAECLDTKEKNR